ncbi:MAG: YraN family protein [Cyanobacteriota bacterium]|nr:YraN family protein [Cyanobacteriota bacterium]
MSRSQRQRSGDFAEQRALRLLRSRGWLLLARQWRCRWGELDLVMAKPGRLLLVEVKGRRSPAAKARSDGLGWQKRARLRRAWACWIADHPALAERPVELVAALVPLPPAAGPVRWIRLHA